MSNLDDHIGPPALGANPSLRDQWDKRIVTRSYDPAFVPASKVRSPARNGHDRKAGWLGRSGQHHHRIAGRDRRIPADRSQVVHICTHVRPSLVLGQAPEGLSCFLLPRFLPDGSQNPIRLVRLKDKLGNRSNASSEIEFEDTAAWLVGDEGKGVQTIIETVNHTRNDCVVGSVGIMRQAVSQAAWRVAHRSAFGAKLIDKPLMANVVADLELEVEAATLMMMRLSGAFDRAGIDGDEKPSDASPHQWPSIG